MEGEEQAETEEEVAAEEGEEEGGVEWVEETKGLLVITQTNDKKPGRRWSWSWSWSWSKRPEEKSIPTRSRGHVPSGEQDIWAKLTPEERWLRMSMMTHEVPMPPLKMT